MHAPHRTPVQRLADEVHHRLLEGHAHDVATVADLVLALDPLLDDASVDDVVRMVRSRIVGLDLLDPLLADPVVDEVMVNGTGDVWVEREGRLEAVVGQVLLEVAPPSEDALV